jgi:hypothetical protein
LKQIKSLNLKVTMTIDFAMSIIGVISFSAIAILLKKVNFTIMKNIYDIIVVGVFALAWRRINSDEQTLELLKG